MSQADVAERSGIPKPRLSRYENDHIAPSLDSLHRLANAIGVPPATLLGDGDVPFEVFVETLRESGISFANDDEARAAAAETIERLRDRQRPREA